MDELYYDILFFVNLLYEFDQVVYFILVNKFDFDDVMLMEDIIEKLRLN